MRIPFYLVYYHEIPQFELKSLLTLVKLEFLSQYQFYLQGFD